MINRVLWVLACLLPILIIPIKGIPDIFNVAKGPVLGVGSVYLIYLLVKEKSNVLTRVNMVLIAYLLFVLAASFLAYKPLLALTGMSNTAGRIEGFLTLFFYAVLFFAAKEHMRLTRNNIVFFLTVQSTVAIYAILQFYHMDPLVEYLNYNQGAYATIGNQNFLASLTVLLFVLSAGFYLNENKWYYVLFPLVFFGALLASNTRGCWLALIAIAFLSLYVLRFRLFRRRYLTLIASLSIMFFTMNFFSGSKIKNRTNTIKNELSLTDDRAGSGRVMIWMMSIDIIKAHPFFGAGPENLKEALKKTKNKRAITYGKLTGRTVDKAHNDLIHIAAVSGIPALILYLSFIFFLFKQNRRHIFRLNLKSVFALAILGYLLQSLFNISVVAVAPLFWILMGLFAQENEKTRIETM